LEDLYKNYLFCYKIGVFPQSNDFGVYKVVWLSEGSLIQRHFSVCRYSSIKNTTATVIVVKTVFDFIDNSWFYTIIKLS